MPGTFNQQRLRQTEQMVSILADPNRYCFV